MARPRDLFLAGCLTLAPGCAVPMQGQQHPDFDMELLLQILNDIDYAVTNYSWLLALLGL